MSAAQPTPEEIANHLLDHYGDCVYPGCPCRNTTGWIGRDCPHWRPWGCRTWAELKRMMEKRRP